MCSTMLNIAQLCIPPSSSTRPHPTHSPTHPLIHSPPFPLHTRLTGTGPYSNGQEPYFPVCGRMFARHTLGACPACYLCIKYRISSPKFILTLGSPPSRPH